MATSPLTDAITLRLALLGLAEAEPDSLVAPLVARQLEFNRRLEYRPCAADHRIQTFLDDYLADAPVRPQLPRHTLVLDRPGLARELSLPRDADEFASDLVSSYRLANGVLHNPANDRRTTAGVFHIAEGGLPIPDDKLAVPRDVFARLLDLAVQPPEEAQTLPYTSTSDTPARCFVSLLLRPLVQPAVAGLTPEKRMEIRFIVPGGLVSNLDFVESVFGNGGDPYLSDNDAALDPAGWTGHTGCVVLAPHLTRATKKSLGLPRWADATERQRRDGMCYRDDAEPYNGGRAFKVCARDARGVIVTLIADNYFGYCKKEVKTQISYSANLLGNAEEEHSGGARVFPSYALGRRFTDSYSDPGHSLEEVLERDPHRFVRQPEGHALDVLHPEFVLVPENPTFSLDERSIGWTDASGARRGVRLRADRTYFTPDGYRVFMQPLAADPAQWTLVGVSPTSTTCHKPSTVSGGGKSEISKAIADAFIFGNLYSPDFDDDMDQVASLLERDYSGRFASGDTSDHRSVLSRERSMGSVIKLFTPAPDFTDEYNAFLEAIPQYIKELVFTVKRFARPEWGDDWREHFTVARINDRLGNFVRLDGDKIMTTMLRVGFETDGSWRLFTLRPDFHPAVKVQTEDDITASVVLPASGGPSRKYVENCESLLFQRPDDAIHRGYDRQAERDIAAPGTFLSNFQPLTHADAREMRDDAVAFSAFTAAMRDLIARFADEPDGSSPAYVVSSADPRLVDGRPSRNPRYLQQRPDLADPLATAASDLAAHLQARRPTGDPLPLPVDVVAAGRRNNPPEPGVPALCPFNPLHYLELPELFMEFISSMTGKSPSTTGAGSEGALTKGPFNALPAIIDLNAAFLSYALSGYDGWVSCAGYVGPHVRIDHDFSLLVPEVFSRMTPAERDAGALIAAGALERLTADEHDGRRVLASRLGYRMTRKFATTYFGRIFMHPHAVFDEAMLRPETQDMGIFADSLDTIVATHERVARAYVADGTIALAIPPLRALLEIMADGRSREGWTLDDPAFRAMFSREAVLSSSWYAERLAAKRDADVRALDRAAHDLGQFLAVPANAATVERLGLSARLNRARAEREWAASTGYLESLRGTLGLQVL
ncbi:MAG TPA: hypothetical protein VFN73_03505 [Propionibacteriaceae bacterium]|nr:hypothetical protein [Propionibacteriaceae bacterium]